MRAAAGGPGSEGYKGKVLRMDRPLAGGFLSLTAFQAEGCGIALSGDEYKVSVTGLAFCVTWHDKHSVIGSLRSPPPFRLRRTSPRESVSHDSQVASLPYESCSLATPVQGAEQPVLKVESLIKR